MNGTRFEARLELRDGITIAHASGEIDIATAPEFASLLLDAMERTEHAVVVDMALVTFLDSTGLAVLIDLLERLRSGDSAKALHLVVPEPQVLKVFEVTKLDGVFSLTKTLADALALVA